MKRTLPRRSNLFLIEMILAILFFALASGVCMQLFMAARALSDKTSGQGHALVEAKSAASVFEAGDGTLASCREQYPNGTLSEDGSLLTVYYDSRWVLCSKEEAVYLMEIAVEDPGTSTEASENASEDASADASKDASADASKDASADASKDASADNSVNDSADSGYHGRLTTGSITVTGKEELCSLDISCYLSAKAGEPL